MHRLVLLASGIVVVSLGCSKSSPPPEAAPPPSEPAPVAVAPVQHTAAKPCDPSRKERAGSLDWFEDDFANAAACARERDVPILVDLWAPWCHTCLSMKTTIFTDPAFAPANDQFVFVSLDTDKDVNAATVGKLPPAAWPTFYVVDADAKVLARFVGSASVPQFQAFLESGRRARAGGAAGADARLLGAEQANQKKDYATAEQELVAALAAAPADWPRTPDVYTSLIAVEQKRGDTAGCMALAKKIGDDKIDLGVSPAASDFWATAMACADTVAPHDDPKAPPPAAEITALRTAAIAAWQKLLADPRAAKALAVDDRSDALAQEREALDALGKRAEAKATAEQQRALLDATAAAAKSPLEAMTYNWPRSEVYVYLGKPLELVAALEKSAADLPKEYDPRARLGWVYWKAGKLPEAAKWTDAALALAYGPRKSRVLGTRADIAKAAGDTATERAMREQQVALWQAMPEGQADAEALKHAQLALASVGKPPATK